MTGSNHLIAGPISSTFVSEQISSHADNKTIGAHAIFLGQVRPDEFEGKTVVAIEYSAYGEMIDATIQSIKDEIFNRYSDLIRLNIWHSTGLVNAGENSLFVLLSSGHRKESFRGLEECVELIKEKLPVWKKECFSDGSFRWIQ